VNRPQHRASASSAERRVTSERAAYWTYILSSSVYHRHCGLPCRSQFSAGARKEPSARKITSRHWFHSQRVSLSQPNSEPIACLRASLRVFPSPSTMHSLRTAHDPHGFDWQSTRRDAYTTWAWQERRRAHRSTSWPSGYTAFAVQSDAAPRSLYAHTTPQEAIRKKTARRIGWMTCIISRRCPDAGARREGEPRGGGRTTKTP
jgi:hypothetical protein